MENVLQSIRGIVLVINSNSQLSHTEDYVKWTSLHGIRLIYNTMDKN